MKSKIKPHLEFVTDDKYPDKIGIRPIGLRSTAWHTKKSVQKYILKLRKEMDFYQELYAQFEDAPVGSFEMMVKLAKDQKDMPPEFNKVVDKMISETKTK